MDGTSGETFHHAVEASDVSPPRGKSFPVVGIGASAGGLEAFKDFLAALPMDTGMAFVLIQHLDPSHDSQLPEILQTATKLPVETVADGVAIQSDTIYIIPPNASVVLQDGQLHLSARERGLHLPIDIFFRSLARAQGSRSIGVVLSGNASDGSEGLRAIKAECGITFAQDEGSARFSGMPRNAAATGVVDYVLPPADIARELSRLSRHPYLIPPPEETADLEVLPDGEPELRKIFRLLQSATTVDFSLYKRTTVRRRIGRRMMVHQIQKTSDYVKYLEMHREEIHELYRDLLITATSFFREPKTFSALTQLVKKRLEENPQPQKTLRLWVPGCSTGEEVYSLAICMSELLQELGLPSQLQLFGTDISELALDRARSGAFPEAIAQDVSPERLARHFTKADTGYQISKGIRESCVFARQDLTKDPPFSHMDIVSCRNVLIYMTSGLQRRILPIFHYSLDPNGLLMLGSAESIAFADDLFHAVDKQSHIYGRKAAPVRMLLDLGLGRPIADRPEMVQASSPAPDGNDLQKRVERVIQSKYSPDAVVIDANLQILQFRGRTSPFLEPSPGEASLNLLRMARENLVLPLRRAIQAARVQGVSVRDAASHLDTGGEYRDVAIEVTPILGPSPADASYLIVFETGARAAQKNAGQPPVIPSEPAGAEAEAYIRQLQTELAETRDHLRSLTEDYEAHAEELRAANEEVRSSNEELQSANEELGTTKEELQSTNEELTTVNEELENRNHELSATNSDLKNLLVAVQIPILMVDAGLRLRRFTAAAERLLEIGPADLGRPIRHVRGKIVIPEIERLIQTVVETLNIDQREVQDENGHWYSVAIRSYRTLDNRIEGAVITFIDIDPLKRAVQAAEEARQYAEGMIETVREPLVVLDGDLRVQRATAAFYDMFQVTREETVGRFFYDLGKGQWSHPRLRELLGNALFLNRPFVDLEVQHDLPHIGLRTMRLNARRIPLPEDRGRVVLLAIEDVTKRREESEIRYRRLFEGAGDGIIVVDPETKAITDVNPFLRELTGYAREDLISKPLQELPLFSNSAVAGTLVDEVMKHGTVSAPEVPLMHASGRSVWTDIIASRYEVGSRPVLQLNIRDVTQRRAAESALRQSKERFRLFLESVTDYALIQLDLDGRIVSWNVGAERVLGYAEPEIIGQTFGTFFTAEDRDRGVPERELVRAREQGRSEDERWHLRKDGTRFFATGVVSPIRDEGGRLIGYSKLMRDITDRKTADERLRASLNEKETLLREIHHRVKNNLQVVASLLGLQSEHAQSEVVSVVLDEMRTRIQSIASIHELLYGAADLSHIAFDEYLRLLVQDLSNFYSVGRSRTKISVEAEPVSLNIALAVPCALIVNELLTNSIKHAFPSGRQGHIHVAASASSGNTLTIEVADDGVGLPDDVDLKSPITMGLQLITTLAEQVQAQLVVTREHGTSVRLQFPNARRPGYEAAI